MNIPVLQLSQLSTGYKPMRRAATVVSSDLDASLFAGEMVCLLGPNGAGKSTLLRTVAGMQPALQGHVSLMGDNVFTLNTHTLAQRLGVVLTGTFNVGLMTGYAVVALGRHPYTDWSGRLSIRDEAVVHWAVEAVGATHLANRYVNELSDGERQKIMIARALAQEPALMILDEPTAFLDLPRRVEIMHLLRRLARETQRAVLLSTHDLDLALRNADRIWLLPGNGTMLDGAPEDLVLSGAFEEAFASEGVHFDRASGAFKIHMPHVGEVYLEGEGLVYEWTRRALEREGITLASQPTANQLRITVNETVEHGPCWQLITPHASLEATSIHALLRHLRDNLAD